MIRISIREITERIPPFHLGAVTVAVATVAAVAVSHALWQIHAGYIPDGLTVVAGGAAILVSIPMVYVFVMGLFELDASNRMLLKTKTLLNFQKQELIRTRDELAALNTELEARVLARTQDLQEALHAAENANTAKSMFLANMSHELRTPLNGIIGYAEMITNRDVLFADFTDEMLNDYSGAIQESGLLLNAMVNDLLDLSKIEFDQFVCDMEDVPINDLISSVVRELHPLAQSRNQSIEVNAPNTNMNLRTDNRALHQVVSNLLSNALKYSSDDACVTIAVECTVESTSIVIEDQGIGMSADALSKASEAFSTFSEAHIASGESIGLGLTIASKLTDLLGGTLSLSSELGKGTRVQVDLPGGAVMAQKMHPALALVG